MNDLASWRDGSAVLLLDEAIEQLAVTGAHAGSALTWTAQSITPEASAAAVQALRARYPGDQWAGVARPLRDLLRERQRDALVAALVPPAQTADDLSASLLIDVEAGACATTSRIEAAMGSVQTFIQRCLLGLEPGVELDAEAAAEWRWMSRFDLWQAQRKIFLYPEDYLHPELRDDKTPFFEELQQELEEGEVTADRAVSLYTHYLEQLDQVARLDICGCYHERGPDPAGLATDRLHVVGRTATSPHAYWYRRLENSQTWTPWEKVPLDINAEEVVLSVAEGRLYLCWPILQETVDPPPPPAPGTITGGRSPSAADGRRPPEAAKHLEIQLAFSEATSQGWAPRRLADGILRVDRVMRSPQEILNAALRSPDQPGRQEAVADVIFGRMDDVPVDFRYWPLPGPREIRLVASQLPRYSAAPELVIRCYLRCRGTEDIAISIGQFTFGGCHGTFTAQQDTADARPALLTPTYLAVSPAGGASWTPMPSEPSAQLDFLTLTARYPGTVNVSNPGEQLYPIRNDLLVLSAGPSGPFRLALPQGGEFLFNDDFFVADDAHSFYVHPRLDPGDVTSYTRYLALSPQDIPPGVIADAWRRATGKLILASGVTAVATSQPWLSYLDVDAVLALAARGADGQPGTWAAVDPTNALPILVDPLFVRTPTDGRYQFKPFDHPYACQFLMILRRGGIDALLQRSEQESSRDYFDATYSPNAALVAHPYPSDSVDFTPSGAYSAYNWELFVHAPLLIAQRLHQDRRFDDALRWYQYVFNPTAGAGPVPARYWNAEPLHQVASGSPVDELREILAGDSAGTPSLHDLVADWRRNPFQPWRVARLRRMAIPKFVVMSYLNLLIDWGDDCFRQYTRESVRNAATLYTWAAQILGRRPVELPAAQPEVRSYATLRPLLDDFSNAVIAVEELMPASATSSAAAADASALRALGTTFYFCIPPNDKLLGYWDTIADRLFKIRHCQDIDGVSRPQPLFDLPIDPDLLVRAAAAGVDLSTVGGQAALSPYRFPVVLAKAIELCSEARAFGSALLAALERRDGEELARLRSTHELAMLDAIRAVRELQVTEADHAHDAVQRSQDIAAARQRYYQGLITNGLSAAEQAQLEALQAAQMQSDQQQQLQALAVITQLIPDFSWGIQGVGGTPTATVSYGGGKVAAALSTHAQIYGTEASRLSTSAARAAAGAGYDRRLKEWQHQHDLASSEVSQLAAQLAAAEVRAAIARKELGNHNLQAGQTAELDQAMRSRFTNLELYSWTVSQLSATYFQAYSLALEAAQRAERGYRYEHPEQNGAFVNSGSWDSLRAGLLAGERLLSDLRRMEAAWLAGNTREYELTKHVSLALLDPLALVSLRAQGETWFTLPETLFDADHPGHYMRRIKAVTLTVPAVIGPYTSVNCTLTLSSSHVRIKPQQRDDPSTVRSYPAAVEQIATSRGHGDPGVFELSFRDERYLPFEGAGAANSNWYLRLDPQCNDWDLQTISDIILEIHYTARDGGDSFRRDARTAMIAARQAAEPPLPARRLFSARTDFADAWYEFLNPLTNDPGQTLRLTFDTSRFPYRAQQGTIRITRLYLAFVLTEEGRAVYPAPGGLSVRVLGPDGHAIPPDPMPLPNNPPAPDLLNDPRELPYVTLPPAAMAVGLDLPSTLSIQLPADQLTSNPGLAADAAGIPRIRRGLLADLLLIAEYTG